MLEKPHLPDEKIASGLRENYGLTAAAITFLPLGNDASAWVYRVTADDQKTYFLKVKQGTLYEASLLIPRYLRDQGIEPVVAPIPTLAGALWTTVEAFTLILYPFITGRSGMDTGLSDRQWIELGTVLKRIHATRLPADLQQQVQIETFSPAWGPMVRALDAQIQPAYTDPYQHELAAFWQEKREEIQQIAARANDLGRKLQNSALTLVLCHADIHTANILLDEAGRLFIVDWDGIILAPKERDLMFVVGDTPGVSREATLFFQGYGKTQVDPVALAYYGYEWVVQEIGDYGERVFLTATAGAETRADSVRGFRQLFQPGDVVTSAYESERNL